MEFVEFNGEEFSAGPEKTKPMASHCMRVADIESIIGRDDYWILFPTGVSEKPFKLNKFNRDKLVAKLTGAE